MSAEHYEDSRELIIKSQTLKNFEDGIQKIKSTIASYGFSQKAVDNLQFGLREFAMHIGEEERRGGAYHYFADGKPFYEMRISTPGSLFEMSADESVSPNKLDDKSQGLLLFFEISMNLVGKVGDVIEMKHGVDKASVHGGGGMPVAKAEFDTAFRCDPKLFLDGLNDLVNYRLGMLVPPVQPAPSGKPGFGGPGR